MNAGGASRQGEMSSAMERLEKETEELSGLVGSLLERIETVCRPSVPSPAKEPKTPGLMLSAALPCRVNQEAMKLAQCVAQLQDALSRLEL